MRTSRNVRTALLEEKRVLSELEAVVRLLHRPYADPKRGWICVPVHGKAARTFYGPTPVEAANEFISWCRQHPEHVKDYQTPASTTAAASLREPQQDRQRSPAAPRRTSSGPKVASSRYRTPGPPAGYTEDTAKATYTIRRRTKASSANGKQDTTASGPPHDNGTGESRTIPDRVIDLLATHEAGLVASEIAALLGVPPPQVEEALSEHQHFGAVYHEVDTDKQPRWFLG